MKQFKRTFILTIILLFCLSSGVYASNFVKIVSPKSGKKVYIGNRYDVKVNFDCNFIDDAVIKVTCKNISGKVIFNKKFYDLGNYKSISFKASTSNLKAGKYNINATLSNVYDSSVSYKSNKTYIKVAVLPKPTGLKLKLRNKKHVKISYKKVTAAKKYAIYRSKNNKRNFKRIKTTSKRSYIDKKVKKGNTYYYKVKAIRYNSKSKFSKIKKIKIPK